MRWLFVPVFLFATMAHADQPPAATPPTPSLESASFDAPVAAPAEGLSEIQAHLYKDWSIVNVPDHDFFRSLYGPALSAAIVNQKTLQTSILIFRRPDLTVKDAADLDSWRQALFGPFLKKPATILKARLLPVHGKNAYLVEYQSDWAKDSLSKGVILAVPLDKGLEILLLEDERGRYDQHRQEQLDVLHHFIDRFGGPKS